jgi:hypothetical protein
MKRICFALTTVLLLTTLLPVFPGGSVLAAPVAPDATIAVTTCNASDLITAVNTANGNGQTDTITLTAGCTYTFSAADNYWYGPNALPAIASNITIEGNGAVLHNTNGTRLRFFYVGANGSSTRTPSYNTPGAGTLTLRNLTLTGGRAKGGDSCRHGGGGAGMGGAIFNQGALTLESVTVKDNTALGGAPNYYLTSSACGGGGMGGDLSGLYGGGFQRPRD